MKLDAGTIVTITNEFLNWSYYEMDPTKPNTWTGVGGLSGMNLNVTHMPSDYRYGAQLGDKASLQSNGYGFSAWIYVNGTYNGSPISDHGDYNMSLTNCTNGVAFDATATVVQPTCADACGGSITINAVGGMGTYSYLWNGGFTGSSKSNLCAGTYTITITSGFCTKNLTVVLNPPANCCAGPCGVDNTAPTATGLVSEITLECDQNFPAVTISDNCTEPVVNYDEYLVSQVCSMTYGPTINNSDIWLHGMPAPYSKWHSWNDARFIRFPDGTAKFVGRAVNNALPGSGFVFEIFFKSLVDWNTWQAQGGYNPGDAQKTLRLYAEVDFAKPYTIQGYGAFAGSSLTLNQNGNAYGNVHFMDLGPRAEYGGYGAGFWISYSGTIAGSPVNGASEGMQHIDSYNSLTGCDYQTGCEKLYVREWIATDACGNPSAFFQTIHQVDTHAPVASADPQDVTVECEESLPSIPVVTFTDNCDQTVTVDISQTTVVNPDGSQTTTRVWTAHDDCNNTTVVNQIVTTLPCRASLGDFVWYDADRDGVQDATETGVAGITVQLYTCAGALVSTVATDANGYYLFSNLVANQSYYVQFSGLPAQYVFSNQDQGGNDNLDSDANSAGRTVCEFLSPGENNMSYDAGINLPVASLGDFVWYDINRDGIQQGTEFGVAGVTVTLYTCDGTQLSTTTTSMLGYYEFAGLEPNQAYYVVFSNLPATWVYSTANAGGNEATDSDADNTGMTACVTLAPGQNYLDLDAGINQPLAALGDFVWSDTDRDGIQDADEPGVEGVTVSLYTCGGTYIATTNTAGNGYYEFLGLEPNADYYVVFSNTPLDYVFSPANNGSTTEALDSDANNLGRTACLHLNPGQFNHDVDAGINLPTASLGNFVWYDTDRDGVQDAGETGVSGVEVDLYTCGGMFLATTTTNASGFYLFTELEPNVEYYVVFSGLPAGYAFSTANSASGTEATDSDASATGQTNCVLLHASENYLDLDAGINLPTAALGDYVWFDENQNGVQDATEHGVGFVTVSLYTCDGTLLNTMTTLDNGYYHFDNLAPNASYYVTFSDIPSGYIFTLQNNGAENVDSDAGADGHTACVFLGPGEVNDDLDAGVTTCPYPHVVGNEPQDLSISCDATLPAVPTVSFVDPIYGTLVPVYEQHFVAATCGGQYVRTWTVTNPCGHTAMVDQIITLFDNTLPVLHNVPANTSVECNTTIADANVTATDNCSTNLSVTMTSQTVAQGCGHVLTRTWSATDACGNTATASQSITIVDTTAPTVTSAPQNTTVECGVVVPVVNPVFTDNCDTSLDVNYSESIGTEACAPDITRTWVATDDCGNTKTVVQHITVVDTTAPTLVGTVAAELTIECNTALPAFAPQFSDVCDSDVAVEITSHQANATSCGYDMVRTAVATDNCGNATTVTQTVHVRDTTAPVLVAVPANATAECGSIPTAANVTATDNCSVATVTMTETQTQGCPYVITRTWTATDVCGNTVSASQQITVVDTQAPVLHGLPADQTVECNAIPAAATGITASDVCDNNVTITYHEALSSGHCTYYIYRTWTATDDCGNVTEHTQSILVHDTTAPVLHNVPGPITIECDQPVPGASVTATDNCDNSPIVEVSTQTQVLDCGQLITRTWLATDNCGNASSATQLITVVDSHAPFVTSQLPAELNIECNTDVPAFNPTFADNCDTELAYSAISGITNVTACGHDIERSVTATDNCGNQTTATQVVHVRDTQAPVLHNVPASITAMCDEIPAVFEGVTATDNCDDQVTLSFEETIVDGAILPGTGLSCGATITRTWTATDDCGHTTSQSQVITVIDTIAPTLIGVPANATAECSDIPAPAVVAAYDNCYSGDIAVHFNQQVIPGNGCTYQIVRVWTAQDNCGNEAIAQQILTVTDTQAPTLVGVPQNATVECNAIPTAALVTAQDNCAADMTVSMNETRTEGCPYTITRTWTVSDLCGNTTSAYQVLTVVDTQAPVLHDVPADATIECSEEISDAVVWATDNCSSDLIVALNATTVDQECGYLFIRTWTVTDACGNTTSQSQTITVVDTTAPVLQLPAITSVEVTCSTLTIDDILAYQNGAMDQATQLAYLQSLRAVFEQNNLLPAGAIDNCDTIPSINEVQIIVEGPSQVECPLVGKITCVFQAMDNCGNLSAAANTYIYIVDHTAPVLHGVPADADAQCGQVPSAPSVSATDDCADNIDVTMTESSTTGCPYVITRTWTATDACGNQSSLSQHITVHDNVAPVLVGVPTNVSQQCGDMPAVATVSAVDNCDDNVEVSFHEVVISNSCPIQVIRTWTATDNCNNTSSATQTIYISDTVAPILHGVPENATVNCHSIPEAPTTVFATDNCSTNLSVTYSEIRASGVCTYYIFRTWTVTDACGNTTSAEQMLTVIDNTPPVLIGVPANVTVSCGEVPAIAAVTAQDDCSEELEVLFSEQTQASGCGYIITRTWSVADYCNHITTATQTITVADTTAPILVGVPANVTIECGQTVPTAVVSANDNCDVAVEVTFVSNTETSECGSVITNTWTATDACGNMTSATQVVTIVDTTDPIVVIQPQAEVWVECGQVMPTAEYAFDDNCDADLNIQAISGISNETSCGYDIERSWIATDNCGNSTTISQVIHVQDTTAPVLVGVPANMFEVECSQVPNPSDVTATDNCSEATVTFTQTEEFFSGCHYLITRTWTATDACGNTSSATQTLLTQDSTAPAIVTAPADVTIECTEALPTAQPTFYDNCDSNLEITFQEEQVQLECGYQILRSWTAADDCYNSVTAVQVITVVDTQAPVFTFTPSNMVVECNTEYEMAQAVAQDNCDSNFEMFYTVQQLPAECGYTIQRTWRAVDACGNEATVSQTIQVTDTTNPVLQNVPADVTIECGTAIPAMPTGVFATDNCDTNVEVTIVDVTSTLPCGTQIHRIFRATDDCGNSHIAVQLINVVDTTAPVISAAPADVTVSCNAIPSAAVLIATDACQGTAGVVMTETIVGVCPYTITRTWTATDACGNAATRVQVITVVDTEDPSFDEFVPEVWVPCDQLGSYLLTATDNCDSEVEVTVIAEQLFSGGCLGTIFRTYQATDNCGNFVLAQQIIHPIDQTLPQLFNVPAGATITCGDALPAVPTDIYATDNCDTDVTLNFTQTQTNQFCPYDVIRTWTAVDQCGNTVTQQQVIHVTVQVASTPHLTAYPNPSKDMMTVEISVPQTAYVRSGIYDVTGKLVFPLINGNADGGRFYKFTVDTYKVESGSYYLMMQIGNEVMHEKLMIAHD